uniref:Uncharacterized protein n=1 Tax=Panagrolaimus superbus TaxID=310955 RepID=A0A914YFG2_9BILA
MLTNSPSNVKYFDGLNIALLGKSLNCENNINNAGGSGITDLGNTFIENSSQDKSFVASIFINAETVCAAKATRVFYTIYRNSKFFVGDNGNGNGIISSASTHKNALSNLSSKFSAATTSKKVLDLPRICKRELLETDGRVVSATALKRTQKGDFKAIHSFETDNDLKNMVTIKYSEDHVNWYSITWKT